VKTTEIDMNGWILAAGVIGLLTTLGHFSVGTRHYLKPMLEASFDPIARKVMHCVFHYVSAFLILSTLTLLLVGSGRLAGETVVVRFVAVNYLVFAGWQIGLALFSGIPAGVMKMFQWVFFIAIAVLAWLGT
jgi:hypothetical protein